MILIYVVFVFRSSFSILSWNHQSKIHHWVRGYWYWPSHATCSCKPVISTQICFLFYWWSKCKFLYLLSLSQGWICSSIPPLLEKGSNCSVPWGEEHLNEVLAVLLTHALVLHPSEWAKCQALICGRLWVGVLQGPLRNSLSEASLLKAVFKQNFC